MAKKKPVETVVKFGVKLTSLERKLLIDAPIFLRTGLAEPIRSTATAAPVILTLDDWEEIAGAVASEASHTKDNVRRKKLVAILSKIHDVFEVNTDKNPPQALRIENAQRERQLTEQMVQLSEWVAKILIGAEQLGIKSMLVTRFPLPEAERSVIMMTPTIDEKIKKKLTAKTPKLTFGEVGGLLMSVAEAMLDAPPLMGVALIMTAKSLMNCLESELKGAIEPTAKARSSASIYRLKITLADIEPPIWRLVDVPDCSLGELHDVIQAAMGWHNSHMHQFHLNGKYYGSVGFDDLSPEMKDEEGIRLSQIFTGKKKPRLIYEYDFGDSWQHEIRLENVLEPELKVKYPRCVQGARACPPEDCGGAWGYADFLEAIKDKNHPGHRDMKEWIGRRFDPEKFEANLATRRMKKS